MKLIMLKKYRKANGLTTKQIADFLHIDEEVYKIAENGEIDAVQVLNIEFLADLYGINVIDFYSIGEVKNTLLKNLSLNKLSNNDLREIAKFRSIIKNYYVIQDLINNYGNKRN